MSELKKHIIETFGFTPNEFEEISHFFKPKGLREGEFFLREGQYVKHMGFVEKGILREYLNLDGKEITKWFSTPGYFALDLSGFLFDQPSKINYQAVCDVELVQISKEDYLQISSKIPRWDKLEKMFLAKCFSILENRVISHLALDAEERYNQLFAFNPSLFNQVPLHQIASMLGMSAETLSRIRKKQTRATS